MKNSFKKELQKEITHRFTSLSLMVSGLLLVFFFVYVFYNQNYQLKSDTRTVETEFLKIKSNGYKTLLSMNEKLIPEFLDNERNEREIYSEYYHLSSLGKFRGDFLLTSPDGEIIFSTNPKWNTNFFAQNYLKTVIIANNQPSYIEKVTADSNQNHYFILMKKIEKQGELVGYSALLLNGNDFFPDNILYDGQFLIADNFDNIFARSGNQFIKGNIEKVQSQRLNKKILRVNGNLFLTKRVQMADNIVLYTYKIFLPISVLVAFSLISVIILMIFMIFISRKLAERIANHNTKIIDLLVSETEKVSQGSKDLIEIKTDDEFEYLAKNINQMLTELQILHRQTLNLEKQSIGFERKMLEAQFNPHFLYNTLETVRITNQFNTEISQKLILSLTRVLRYSLDHVNEDTFVADDMKILEDFLSVNAIRFEKFTYKINVEEKLKKMNVPRLFLLPVIENSIKYGMQYREDLAIEINVYQKDQEIIFEVLDNGTGFSEATIESIYSQYNSVQTQHGLINSFRRLRMVFSYADLRIINHNEGAVVQFVIWEENNV